jgi:hypothetical protein
MDITCSSVDTGKVEGLGRIRRGKWIIGWRFVSGAGTTTALRAVEASSQHIHRFVHIV